MSRTDARTVDRKQLYDLVWSRPMIHVAAGFGISGNGLAKACRKLDIPCPPRGYRPLRDVRVSEADDPPSVHCLVFIKLIHRPARH